MNKFKGKFGEALKAAKEDKEKPNLDSQTGESALTSVQPPEESTATIGQTDNKAIAPQTKTKRGRPKGKRSDPDFEQVTAYIRSKTYRQTKIALLQQDELEDFSELIEKLLTEWLSTQKGENSKT